MYETMAKAYVLINCDLGSEDDIIRDIRKLEYVKDVTGTFGAYDIVARVEADTPEQLREAITWKIRKMNKIRSTLTLMEVEGQGEKIFICFSFKTLILRTIIIFKYDKVGTIFYVLYAKYTHE